MEWREDMEYKEFEAYDNQIKSLESRLAESEKKIIELRNINQSEALLNTSLSRKLTHTEETLNKAIVIIKELLETSECHLDHHFEFLVSLEQKEKG